jgi:hypothetical protein
MMHSSMKLHYGYRELNTFVNFVAFLLDVLCLETMCSCQGEKITIKPVVAV